MKCPAVALRWNKKFTEPGLGHKCNVAAHRGFIADAEDCACTVIQTIKGMK